MLLEQPVQLSVQGRHGDFSFRTEFAPFPDLGLFFPSTKSLQHLKLTHYLAPVSWCSTTRRRQAMGSPHLMMLAAGYRWLPLAAENQRHRRCQTVPLLSHQGFGGCECGGKVVVLGVEAVSPREAVDRRVLTAGVDASLGLITCERIGFSQTSVRSATRVSPDSSHREVSWDKRTEMGQARQGVVDETRGEWMTYTVCRGASRPKHLEPSSLEPHASARDGQMCATLRKMCVRRGDLSSVMSCHVMSCHVM